MVSLAVLGSSPAVAFAMLRGRLLPDVARLRVVARHCTRGGRALRRGGYHRAPLLIAIMLSATSLGVVIPVLKDSGEAGTSFGQMVIAAASIADIATIVLLSLFFSDHSSSVGSEFVLLGGFALLVAAIGAAVTGPGTRCGSHARS